MMHRNPQSTLRGGAAAAFLVLITGTALAGCAEPSAKAAGIEAVHVVKVGAVKEIHLTAQSSSRLGIETTPIALGAAQGQLAIPFSALLYDAGGATFVYVNTTGLVFVRADVSVATITGGTVVLSKGPAAGTKVVTIGAAELFGVDTGVGGGH